MIELEVSLAANGSAPAHATGLVEHADGEAALGQLGRGRKSTNTGPDNANRAWGTRRPGGF
jgi:hypothetical protein